MKKHISSHLLALPAALALAALAGTSAQAVLVAFSGSDNLATTASPHPNSAAAAASFDAAVLALGSSSLVTFETAPLGTFTNLTIATGVTINGTDLNAANQTIRNSSNFPSGPTLDGYNTTSGGSEFVEVFGGNLVFTFATPIQSFGAYFSGIQTNYFADTVTFSDGSSQSIFIPGAGTTVGIGALAFVGFTDAGKAISSVTITAGDPNLGQDAIGVDDVRFQQVRPIPEPATVLFGVALLGVCAASRRRKASA